MKTQSIIFEGELDRNDRYSGYYGYSGDKNDFRIDKDNLSEELKPLIGKKVKITIEVVE